MTMKNNYLEKKVDELKQAGVYRVLPVSEGPCEAIITLNGKQVINLSSNNYLGLANHPRLIDAAVRATIKYGVGAGAVRTIVGNMDIHEELDRLLAAFKKEEAAIVFQSGFACNAGAIQAIADSGDLIISDELNHASIIDGVRLSKADKAVYRHSDIDHLEALLKEKRPLYNQVLIITDGVFSMDGDIAKLPDIVRLAKQYGAMTYVDDAHGSGVLGENGRGTVDYFHLHGQVDFLIGTLSKAVGVIGGYVAGSKAMREWLLHRGRPLLFSTAMTPSSVAAIMESIRILSETTEYTDRLWDNARYFKQKLVEKGFDIGRSETPITPIMVGDEAKTMRFSKTLLERGVYVSGIVFPTVAKGKGRIRCMISALHTKDQIDFAVEVMSEVAKELNIF